MSGSDIKSQGEKNATKNMESLVEQERYLSSCFTKKTVQHLVVQHAGMRNMGSLSCSLRTPGVKGKI